MQVVEAVDVVVAAKKYYRGEAKDDAGKSKNATAMFGPDQNHDDETGNYGLGDAFGTKQRGDGDCMRRWPAYQKANFVARDDNIDLSRSNRSARDKIMSSADIVFEDQKKGLFSVSGQRALSGDTNQRLSSEALFQSGDELEALVRSASPSKINNAHRSAPRGASLHVSDLSLHVV